MHEYHLCVAQVMQLLAPPAVRRTAVPSAGVRCRGTDRRTAHVVHVNVVVVGAVHNFVPAVYAVVVVGGEVCPLLRSGAGQCVHTEPVQG